MRPSLRTLRDDGTGPVTGAESGRWSRHELGVPGVLCPGALLQGGPRFLLTGNTADQKTFGARSQKPASLATLCWGSWGRTRTDVTDSILRRPTF